MTSGERGRGISDTRAMGFHEAAGWLPVAGTDNQDEQGEVRYEMQRCRWLNVNRTVH